MKTLEELKAVLTQELLELAFRCFFDVISMPFSERLQSKRRMIFIRSVLLRLNVFTTFVSLYKLLYTLRRLRYKTFLRYVSRLPG